MGLLPRPICPMSVIRRYLESEGLWHPLPDVKGEIDPPRISTIVETSRAWGLMRSLMILAIVGFFLVNLAPTQMGGRAGYVVVTGNSMEPNLYRGDLAVLHRTNEYRTGDIVVYQHPELGQVIHRIIERDGNRFVLQGDHNSWIDSYEPSETEIAGKLIVRIPRAGSMIWGFRTPIAASFLAAVLGYFLFWPHRDPSSSEAEAG